MGLKQRVKLVRRRAGRVARPERVEAMTNEDLLAGVAEGYGLMTNELLAMPDEEFSRLTGIEPPRPDVGGAT